MDDNRYTFVSMRQEKKTHAAMVANGCVEHVSVVNGCFCLSHTNTHALSFRCVSLTCTPLLSYRPPDGRRADHITPPKYGPGNGRSNGRRNVSHIENPCSEVTCTSCAYTHEQGWVFPREERPISSTHPCSILGRHWRRRCAVELGQVLGDVCTVQPRRHRQRLLWRLLLAVPAASPTPLPGCCR